MHTWLSSSLKCTLEMQLRWHINKTFKKIEETHVVLKTKCIEIHNTKKKQFRNEMNKKYMQINLYIHYYII